MTEARRDVFQGIADPTRRQILSLIAEQPLHLNAIADHFPISRPAVSQHIRILTECGLITVEQQGRQRYCSPELDTLNQVADWIEPFRELWEARFGQLDHLLDEMQSKPDKTAS